MKVILQTSYYETTDKQKNHNKPLLQITSSAIVVGNSLMY